MKQIAQNYKSGKMTLEEVDPPILKRGMVLVRTAHSVISPGTEGTKINEAKMNLVQKAKARPDHVKKVIATARQQGLASTYRKVMNKLDSLTPLGYSASGIIEAIGADVTGFQIGQRVAIAGAGYANHAECNSVPASLVTAIPDDVALDEAAFATMGTVSMHGLRQGEVGLGDVCVVIGLGLVGQLLTQMLAAAGTKVIAIDLSMERCDIAIHHSNAHGAFAPDDNTLTDMLDTLSHGHGADCVFLTVGSSSNAPLEQALDLVRDRGKIICIGKTKMDLPYDPMFKKEVDIRYSRSYGPGRYDPSYEEGNQDYPIGYVRWTEGRNLAEVVDLIAQKKLNIAPLITHHIPFTDAITTYDSIHDGSLQGMGIVFDYDADIPLEHHTPTLSLTTKAKDNVGIGCIGAGAYASSMLLPFLKSNKQVRMEAVANATALSAKNAETKFGFSHSGTDYSLWLEDDAIDAVIIATRHASHPHFVCEALKAGKAVFVEKPLSTTIEGMEHVRQTIEETGNNRLMVGFNRRFSPIIQQIKETMGDTPAMMHYRVFAGQLENTHWSEEADEGGRFIGEAGHFIDVCTYLAASKACSISAASLDQDNNLSTTIHYKNGSVATLHYVTHGGAHMPKERLEILCSSRSFVMDNFESLTVFDSNKKPETHNGFGNKKGQQQQMDVFIDAIRNGTEMPISISLLYETTELTIRAKEAARDAKVIYFD